MQMKGIVFGFGLGIVFLAAVFLFAYRVDMRETEIINDIFVVERASELGMVWATHDAAEIVRRALDMGMVFEDIDEEEYESSDENGE